jgi:NAD(P)-dependent dehydrogenase (short-subunit alcohol dehydrogenase family)
MARLAGKVALVTGAKLTPDGPNIGGATAALMAREGARVMVADHDLAGAERLAAQIRTHANDARAIAMNFADRASLAGAVEGTVAAYGRIDILSNNAMVLFTEDYEALDVSAGAFDDSLTLNSTGYFILCQAAIRAMLETGGGSIVNVSSNASIAGDAGRIAYAACKAAINSITQSIATQYGKRGIRCNAILPGLILSPSARAAMDDNGRALFLRHILTPQLGVPENIASTALFLASDEAAYITGQLICVDGGQLAHHPGWADQVDRPVGSLGSTESLRPLEKVG